MAPPRKRIRKAPRTRFSPEERTPKKLKALEPDCTVVCGGEKFYHYKVLLCSGSDFFDTMLSNEMKEREESQVELFPEKDPHEWLEVYAFIEKEADKSKINATNAKRLVTWFDFLGMRELANECDRVYAQNISVAPGLDGFETKWNEVKSLPCPTSQNVVLSVLKRFLSQFKDRQFRNRDRYGYARSAAYLSEGLSAAEARKVKALILDEIGGERVWQTIKNSGYLHFPPVTNQLDRVELAENPLFEYLLRKSHRPLGQA